MSARRALAATLLALTAIAACTSTPRPSASSTAGSVGAVTPAGGSSVGTAPGTARGPATVAGSSGPYASGQSASSGSPAPPTAGPTSSGSDSATAPAGSPAGSTAPAPVPATVSRGVRAAIDQFNSTAGGSPSAQQQQLRALLAPGQAGAQQKCGRATTTIELEPVYPALAPSPTWRPSSGTFSGAVYSLPTLIRIYTGPRITGIDLTDLHLSVDGREVRFPALCVN